MAWTAPRTWVAGEIPTAADFNTHVRDNFNAIGVWQNWTPTLLNGDLGDGSLFGAVAIAGESVTGRLVFNWGSTTSNSGQIRISAPTSYTTSSNRDPVGNGVLRDDSTGDLHPRWVTLGGTPGTIEFRFLSGNGIFASGTDPFTFADGDSIVAYFTYQAGS